MSNKVVVYKNRRNVIQVQLGINVAGQTITSEIRSEPDVDAPLIATWTVAFTTDGTDGKLTLTLDDSALSAISATSGYMDLKRVAGGEPYAVFDSPLEVVFKGSVTA